MKEIKIGVQLTARSEEHLYDKKFISRWADRCEEMFNKYGQQVANSFASKMFSPECMKEINIELERRKAAKQGKKNDPA